MDEAANIIAEQIGTQFDHSDLYWLALDSQLQLSIRLRDETPIVLDADVDIDHNDVVPLNSKHISWVDGLWDLVVFSSAISILENHATEQHLTESLEAPEDGSLWISEPESGRLGAVKCLGYYPAPFFNERIIDPDSGPDCFRDAYELPKSATIVIRTAELERFLSKLEPARPPSRKTANKDAQIIHSLASALVGDLGPQPNKNAEAVSQALAQAGVEMPCTSRTLADRFKRAMND